MTFTALGAAKCSKCKRFSKILHCDDCKEIQPVEDKVEFPDIYPPLKDGTEPIVVAILILVLAVLGCVIYGLFPK